MTRDPFAEAGYYPTTCNDHDQPHAVNRDPRTGDMRCTAGCLVEAVPDVADHRDPIRDVLQRWENREC